MTEQQRATDGQPALVVYWRPGCVFCMRLRLYLWARRIPARWINIWGDRDAAALVRSVARGNETVPTVSVAGEMHVNPSPRKLAALLGAGGGRESRGEDPPAWT